MKPDKDKRSWAEPFKIKMVEPVSTTIRNLSWFALPFPRRVYTQSHVVAESVETVYHNRENITGLEFDYEPEYLRFFQSRFRKRD